MIIDSRAFITLIAGDCVMAVRYHTDLIATEEMQRERRVSLAVTIVNVTGARVDYPYANPLFLETQAYTLAQMLPAGRA